MRVLYFHQYFTTPDYYGGVRSYQHSKRIIDRGHEVDMITSTAFYPIKKKRMFQLVSRFEVEGIRVHAIHLSYNNSMGVLRRLLVFGLFMIIAVLYSFRLPRPNIVYATSTPLSIGLVALIAKYFFRVPLVFEVRDLWPDVPIALGYLKNRVLIRGCLWFEKVVYQSASRVIALSSGIADGIENKGIDSRKIVCIPNGCDMAEFSAPKTEIDPFRFLRSRKESKICLYAGTFGYVNDVEYLVYLAKSLAEIGSPVKIVLVGDGKERERVEIRIRALGVSDNLMIFPPVSKNKLIDYIHWSDACFSVVRPVPQLYSNSANKFFDSLAAGKPILINHEGWQAEEIRKATLGLVLNGNFYESALRLNKFLSVNSQNYLVERRIKKYAAQKYSRDLLVAKLIDQVLLPAISEWSKTGNN